jgi:hypothetical protein
MTIPTSLPDWLPWWAALMVLVPVVLYVLAFLAMPFSVLGLKGRLESIEARLDEIQGEVRAVALRLPERGMYLAEAPRPPIPPAPRAASQPDRRETEYREPEPRPRFQDHPVQERRPQDHDGWQEPRRPTQPAPRVVADHEADDPAPPDPSAAPARRPLRPEPRREAPTHTPPPRTPPRLDWPR